MGLAHDDTYQNIRIDTTWKPRTVLGFPKRHVTCLFETGLAYNNRSSSYTVQRKCPGAHFPPSHSRKIQAAGDIFLMA